MQHFLKKIFEFLFSNKINKEDEPVKPAPPPSEFCQEMQERVDQGAAHQAEQKAEEQRVANEKEKARLESFETTWLDCQKNIKAKVERELSWGGYNGREVFAPVFAIDKNDFHEVPYFTWDNKELARARLSGMAKQIWEKLVAEGFQPFLDKYSVRLHPNRRKSKSIFVPHICIKVKPTILPV